MTSKFRKTLASGQIIIFDGAMGTMLAALKGARGSVVSIIAPATVPAVHRLYREAGADVLITNTFDGNTKMRADWGTQTAFKAECQKACLDARVAADVEDTKGLKGFVAGDMGPMGVLLEPHGTIKLPEMEAVFLTTAILLAKYGVDLFIVETMTDEVEMMLAVNACRKAASAASRDIPIAASMAFDPSRQGGFRTNMGVAPAEAARAMDAAGADIIGANCGSVTPVQMAEIVREFRSVTDKPILIQPNAGVPELQAGRTVFRLSPEAFAEGMKRVLETGAQLVGGCCGTTPEHIRRLRQVVDKR